MTSIPSLSELTASLRRTQFYLISMRPPSPLSDPRTHLAEHLHEHLLWLHRMEAQGTLFLSGAMADETGWDGSGLAIIRAGSHAEAELIAADEPFSRAGLRNNTVSGWQLNEGSLTVRLRVMADSLVIE